jgi:hypothetical protein
MKKRFTEQQIAFALRQAASGTPVAEIVGRSSLPAWKFLRFAI